MKLIAVLVFVLGLALLSGCTLFRDAVPVAIFTPQSGHGPTAVTITVADMGAGWSYNLEQNTGSKLYTTLVFTVTVYPPATLYVSGRHNDGRVTERTTIEITLKNSPPVGYDPFGPLANFLVPGQMYVVDCNYHEWSAGFEWSAPIRAGFIDPEGDPWKITNVECWYMLNGARVDDPVFTPPLSPGEIEYHVGTDLVPADGHRIDNAFIIWPAIAHWVYDDNGVAIPVKPLPSYTPPCGDYEITGTYIPPGTIYHVEIWTVDVYGAVGYFHGEKPLSGRADCNSLDCL